DTSWAFMKYLIDQKGLQDVTMVNVALGSELAAVAGGQADLALSFEPTVSQAVVDQGLEVVYSFPANPDWYPFAFSSLTTTEIGHQLGLHEVPDRPEGPAGRDDGQRRARQ